MLDTDTKRRIDTARDILVGKVPDPKSQVEQITIALIYKFMDDMDAEAEELGGERAFFTGDFARYGWAKLMAPSLGGHEMLGLYGEGISKMPENPGIPALFRDIFKNAYLPYRDPETLKAFLKIIDEFSYDHSERLGDAFEYLLSVLGSQGDAGQFRTPRHIIDFMVEVLDPQKNETILDPACGTAGFLISAYKHILHANTDAKGHSQLTPDEKGRLAKNFRGYDISPDMVRLSLVNLYLHGFTDPHIYEYDSLTSEERWNEFADVILANPPFMSPKGGIKPHKRFSIQAKRSEVLFVDYMAEHLTPNGRAAIIVPEGIIFQSQTAYKDLRKMLVENSLVAVISLPSGCFNPYSGVKTSILLLDKSRARQSETIGFFKVENDGFGLGAQRRAIEKNDLPQVQAALDAYLNMDGQDKQDQATALNSSCPSCASMLESLVQSGTALIVPKEKIAANGDYNLSGERYGEPARAHLSDYPTKKLGEVCKIRTGKKDVNSGNENGKYPFFTCARQHTYSNEYSFDAEAILIAGNGDVGAVQYFAGKFEAYQRTYVLTNWVGIEGRYLYFLLSDRLKETVSKLKLGNTMPYIKLGMLTEFPIPLPPLEVQKEIVTEIEGYQKVINGARAVLDNYRPHIPIYTDWPILELSEVTTKITDGAHFTPTYVDEGVPFLRVTDITESSTSKKFIPREEHEELIKRCRPEKGDVLYSKNGTIGIAKLVDWDWEFSIFVSLCLIKPKKELLDPHYLKCFLNSDIAYAQATARSKSGTVTNLHLVDIKTIKIPLPPLATQQAIVAEIEAEQALVSANRELITRFEQKIQATLARIWDEEAPCQASKSE
jgi:type I restriction enzyme M protein